MITESSKYEAEVLRRLETFKSAVEWSDFIGLLGNLDAVLEKYKLPYIPHHALLVKRLNQCLNPVLPAGVHLKTLETYGRIFSKLPRESLIVDFSVLTLGLFVFGTRCRILVTNDYLDLLENHIVPLVPDAPISSILIGLLPTLESESSEFYDRTLLILMKLQGLVDPNIFYNALWRVFIEYPVLHISIANLLGRAKQLVLPDYRVVVRGLCCGLESKNMYTIRSILDLVSYDYPLKAKTIVDRDGRVIDIDGDDNLKESLKVYNSRLIRSVLALFLKKESGVNKRVFKWLAVDNEREPASLTNIEAGLRTYLNGKVKDMQILFKILFALSDKEKLKPAILEVIIFDLISSMRKMDDDLEKFVRLFKDLGLDYIYRLFYIKLEESMNSSGIDELSEEDENEDAIPDEAGNSNDDAKHSSEKDLDGSPKDDEPSRASFEQEGSLGSIPKDDDEPSKASFEQEGGLRSIPKDDGEPSKASFEQEGGLRSIPNDSNESLKKSSEQEDSRKSTPNVSREKKTPSENALSKWTTNEILDVLIYTIRDLKAIDSNVKAIHLPLLANLVVKNRVDIDEKHFFSFMALFIEHTVHQPEKSATSVSLSSISEAYRTESFKAIMNADLVSLVAHGYGHFYDGSEAIEQAFELRPGKMHLKDGVIVYKDESGNKTENLDCKEQSQADGKEMEGDASVASKHSSSLFRPCELQLIQSFIKAFSIDVFSDRFLKILAAGLVRNYQYKFLVDTLEKHIKQEELHKSIWSDFIRTGISTFFLFYDLSDFIVNTLHSLDKECIFMLLSNSLNHQKYYSVFFLLSTIGERDSDEFSRLILSIDNPLPLLVYLLQLYNDCNTNAVSFRYLEQPNYNKISSILKLIIALLDNAFIIKTLNSNLPVSIARFDCQGINECLCRMLSNLIITTEEDEDMAEDRSVEDSSDNKIDKGKNEHSIHQFNESIMKHANASQSVLQDTPSEFFPSNVSSKGAHSTANHKKMQMDAFNLLNKMHNKGVSVALPNMDQVKRALSAKRHIFYIVMRSLFLVEDDINFIIRNYLTNFNEIFLEISKLDIKWKFFNMLVKKHEHLSIGMLHAMFSYTLEMPKFDWSSYYEIALRMVGKAVKNPQVSQEDSESKDRALGENNEVSEDADAKLISLAISLCGILYSHNQMLFTKYFIGSDAIEELFALLPFKNALFTKMLSFENSNMLLKLVKYVEPKARTNVFITKNDYFKSSVYLRIDYSSTMLILYLINGSGYKADPNVQDRSGEQDDDFSIIALEKYKTILENILYALENRINSGIKLDLDFQHDLDILEAMGPLLCGDVTLITNYKSCLFALLASKRFRYKAFEIIAVTIRQYPFSKPLSDAFILQMNEEFFKYAIDDKSELLGLITASSSFNITPLTDRFFSGLETSYFISHQNSIQQKAQVLKKLAFLILSNPYGRFDAYAARLVSSINALLGSNDEIKTETYRLCIAVILRIDISLIGHLYPLILEDFMRAYEPGTNFTEGIGTARAMIEFIDICMWLRDEVFDFKALFLPDSTFSKCCISLSISRGSRNQNEEDNIEYRDFISDHGSYVNLMFKTPKSGDLTWYFKEAYKFYEHVEVCFCTRDAKRVEEMLFAAFLEE